MKAYITFITTQLAQIWKTFDRICKPHPNISRGQIQQEVIHQRNKAVTLFHLFVLFCMLLQTIVKSYPLINGVITIGVCSLIIGLLLLSCHYHPEFFNITYNITMGLSGPILMCTSLQGGHRAWVGAQMYPTLVFFCTGSLYHLIFQASTQIVLLNTIYQPEMLNYLDFTSSTEFLRSLTLNSSTMCFFNMVIIIFINASLNNAYNKVQVAENKKDEFERQKIFLLSFSHELRNIINSLIGNVRLAILENVSVKAKDFLANADLCGESLLHLINNILDSGKVEIGDLEINPVPTEIYDTIQRIWRICSEQIKGKHLYGSLKIQKNIPKTLQIDHYRLMQIFFNLIGNAVKFTERGSINATVEWIENTETVIEKNFEPYPFDEGNDLSEGVFEKNQKVARFNESYLTLASSASKIDLTAIENRPETTKGLLKVIITDTGSGIASEDAAKLFQKFSQVSSDPGQRKLGTGLGLFITKQLCERMGGEIRVFSKQGKGSSFIFCIPTTPLVSNRLSTFANDRQETKNIKALVVDDELLSRTILENYFNKLQIEVVSTAKNGLEAFNNYKDCYYKGNYIDLVTMDLTMPVMDGKKAAEKIREFEKENGIVPCLMMVISANCSESEIMECTDKNGKIRADFFLKKPARIDEIARAVSNYYKSTSTSILRTE